MPENNKELETLIEIAKKARRLARAAYSGFSVGAALEADDGRIFTGCNIESSSYGLTICAERVALFKALSEGAESFTRLVIVTGANNPTSPCGACRQLLWDYARGVEIILIGKANTQTHYSIAELFPRPFGSEDL